MWVKVVLQGNLGNRNSSYYGGVASFEDLRAAIGKLEQDIFEELKVFEDDSRADCLMCFIWPSGDLRVDERNRDLRLAKRDRTLEGSGCLEVQFVRNIPVTDSARRLFQFGLGLLTDAMVRYKFNTDLIMFLRKYREQLD